MNVGPEDLQKIGDYVCLHLPEWMHGFRNYREIDLIEHIVREEEELKSQRELMKQGFFTMEKRMLTQQWITGLRFTLIDALMGVFNFFLSQHHRERRYFVPPSSKSAELPEFYLYGLCAVPIPTIAAVLLWWHTPSLLPQRTPRGLSRFLDYLRVFQYTPGNPILPIVVSNPFSRVSFLKS